MKKIISLFYLLLISQINFAQSTDSANIKTVNFRPIAVNSYAPIIRLGERLSLSFDDLLADERDYYYKIVHCDENWEQTDILESEYIDGYAEDRIRNYSNSFNTLIDYTNYKLTIPNEYTRIKISGNYLISIINDDDEVMFKRRFVVYSTKVTVGVSVHKDRNVSKINSHQVVKFSINKPNFRINDPKREIYPVILQNNNWQTAILGLKPQFIRGNQYLYSYNDETRYSGGNEFLYLDTKAIRELSINIANIEKLDDIYNTYLYTDIPRVNQPYTLFEDINGNFVIRTLYGDDPNVEADYSWVHFKLRIINNSQKEIYLSGNFNNWQLNDENKLVYNEKIDLHEGKLLLKQGFYNYQYVTKNIDGKISNYDISGSHYQTENDYTVLIYYKPFGARYTEVIGAGFGNSRVLMN